MAASTLLPPGPRLPRALATLGWVKRPRPFLERIRARYGDVFTLRIANERTWVMLGHPDGVRQVFTADPGVARAGEANALLRPVLGARSLLLLDREEHLSRRKLMLPPFHGERMQRYGDLMREVAEAEIATWPVGHPRALLPSMQAITLEVIMRAVFGLRRGTELDRLRGLLRELLDWTVDPRRLLYMILLGPDRIERLTPLGRLVRRVDEALLEELARRRDGDDLAGRDDILSALLRARYEDGEPMADDELCDQLITLLVAGHETTATALTWALERLVRHPETLGRLREEVAAGEDAYADAVVRETLRLRPVLPIVLRHLSAPMRIGEWHLPAGIALAPCIHLVHRHPDVYPEPASFRPERFLEQSPGTYSWIPFGGGVRRCLGASFALYEMRIVLAAIVAAGRLRPAATAAEHVVRRAIVWAPSRGGEVVLDRRGPQGSVPASEQAWPGGAPTASERAETPTTGG